MSRFPSYFGSRLGALVAVAFLASARGAAIAQPPFLGRDLIPSLPPTGHDGGDCFRATQKTHDFQPKRGHGPNPRARKPHFNKHSYF